MLTVSSDRLLLMACSAQVARAAFNGRRHAEVLIRYRVHPDWPSAEIHGYLPVYARQVENDPALIGWGVWMIIHVADQVVIGDVGFKGRPNARGAVDIGYGIVPEYRRQGFGFEAARALRDWAFEQPGVQRLTADCRPDNVGSIRILEKLGLQRIGVSNGGLLLWELAKEA
ncbi:MAG: GNAT family N-acetyltransferase [Chloroflexota bacterium]|nr:MAG: GNAT family N-acetyltransferase [Chloroflexota bacterium]